MRAKRKVVSRGFVWIAFGAGCFAACWFPETWMCAILALLVVILGIVSCQCC